MSTIRGDAVRLPLRDESVDLIVTSPPYFALRSYRDDGEHYNGQIGSEATPSAFLAALWACTAEWQRVLKPTGSLWVNLGDKYAGSGGHNNGGLAKPDKKRPGAWDAETSIMRVTAEHQANRRNAPDRYNQNADGIRPKSLMGLPWRYAIGCIDGRAGAPLILRAEVVWSKPNGLPESVTDRVRRSHEQWFHMTKEGRYYSAVDEVREPAQQPERSLPGVIETDRDRRRGEFGVNAVFTGERERIYNPLGKLPSSVWTIPTDPLIVSDAVREHYNLPDHFAAFPQEWPRRIILGWSPAGICTRCGEGRRPVCERASMERHNGGRHDKNGGRHDKHRPSPDGTHGTGAHTLDIVPDYRITGHACACPTPDAPTRKAIVCDPFSGTGTVAGVANALGRVGVGVDLSHDYNRLAQWFLRDGRRFGKAASRTDGERQGVML